MIENEQIYQKHCILAEITGQLRGAFIFFPVFLLVLHVFLSFERAFFYWLRHKELEADSNSCKASPPLTVATTLLKVEVLSPMIEKALEHYEQSGYQENLLMNYITMSISQQPMTDVDELLSEQPSPNETHPTITERLAPLSIEITSCLINEGQEIEPTCLLTQLAIEDLASFEHQYQQYIQYKVNARIEELKQQTDLLITPVTIKQGGALRLLFFVSVMLLTIVVMGMLWNREIIAHIIPFIMMACLSLFCISKVYSIYKRINSVLLVLLPEGLKLPELDSPIPWNQIKTIYTKRRVSSNIYLVIDSQLKLHPITSLGAAIQYQLKKHRIKISLSSLKTDEKSITCRNADELYNLLYRYQHAYLISQELLLLKASAH